MKITNPQAVLAYNCLSALIRPGNVLPGLTGLRADRNLRKLEPIASPYEKKRVELIQRLGTQGEDGSWTVEPGSAAWKEFAAEHDPMAAEEHDLDLYVIPLAEILKGYSSDAEGTVRLLNFAGAELGALERLGIVTDGDPADAPTKGRRQRRPQ